MSFRNSLQTLTVPEGAGPGESRFVVTGPEDMPEPLKSDGYDGALIMYSGEALGGDDSYQFIAWNIGTLSIDPFVTIGNVFDGAYQTNTDGNPSIFQIVNHYGLLDNSTYTFLADVGLGYMTTISGGQSGLRIRYDGVDGTQDFKVVTATNNFWSMSRAYRAVHVQTTDLVTALTTPQLWFERVIPGCQPGRTYVVELECLSSSSSANDSGVITVVDGSNVALPGVSQSGRISYIAAGQGTSGTALCYFTVPSNGSFTIRVRGHRNSGIGTLTFSDCVLTVLDATDILTTG